MTEVVPSQWRFVDIDGPDVVDATRTLKCTNNFSLNEIGPRWQLSSTYIDWAHKDLLSNDARGWSNAIANAKRGVCRRIDTLLLSCNLDRFASKFYPDKIKALQEIGVSASNVIHELIIDPRNGLEHQYANVVERDARHAVEIADLFEKATRPKSEDERSAFARPLLFGDINDVESIYIKKEGWSYRLTSLPDGPLLLVDCEAEHAIVYILDLPHAEARQSRLSSFSESDAIKFAKWCGSARHATSGGIQQFRSIKAGLGIG